MTSRSNWLVSLRLRANADVAIEIPLQQDRVRGAYLRPGLGANANSKDKCHEHNQIGRMGAQIAVCGTQEEWRFEHSKALFLKESGSTAPTPQRRRFVLVQEVIYAYAMIFMLM